MIVLRKRGCFWAKVVLIEQGDCIRAKWLYSQKRGFFRTNMVVFGQSGCIWEKIVVIVESGCIRAEVCSIRAKVVVFGRGGCI